MMTQYSVAPCFRLMCSAAALAASVFVASAQNASPAIVSRSAHERQWLQTNEVGEVQTSFTEIGAGICYWDEAAKVWRDSNPEIEIRAGFAGGIADKAHHKLKVSPNANTPNGTVDVTMPDGNLIRLTTVGIALTSFDNAQSEFIAELQDSHGEKVDATTVIYRNAFAPIKADLRVRNSLGGVQSDVILRERIDPTEWGFQADNCRLEVWTRIVQAPGAKVNAEKIGGRAAGGADQDQQIDFTSMSFTKGTAFPVAGNGSNIRVAKTMIHLAEQNASFLIEAVPFSEAAEALQELPLNEARVKQKDGPKRMVAQASVERRFPVSHSAPRSDTAERVVALLNKPASETSSGYVIDYDLITSQSGYTFRGDRTYYASGSFALTGTTTFEGGTTIKLANGVIPTISGPVKFLSSHYRPAVITAVNDHTVGDKIGTADQALSTEYSSMFGLKIQNATTANSISNIVIRHAETGIRFESGAAGEVRHAQIVNCPTAISTATSITLRNVLIANSSTAAIVGGASAVIGGEHLTINIPTAATRYSQGSGSTLTLRNSIIYGGASAANYTKYNTVDSWSVSPFKVAGAGAHYLDPAVAGARDAGVVASIDARLLLEFKQMTTEGPTKLAGPISTPTTLYPSARRDTDMPDLGYHYDPLDYYFTSLGVSSTLTVAAGVHLAMYGNVGVSFSNSGGFISKGVPDNLNRFVHYQMVQDQPTVLGWPALGTSRVFLYAATQPAGDVNLSFCELSPGGGSSGLRHVISKRFYCDNFFLSNSVMRNVAFGYPYDPMGDQPVLPATTLSLKNNCWERGNFFLYSDSGSLIMSMFNNLFWQGSAYFYLVPQGYYWSVYDNLFDTETLGLTGSISYVGNNAYASGLSSLGGSGNKTGIVADYQPGPLGRFYYPLSGANLATLVNAGSQLAVNAGLAHFTTKLDNVKEINDTTSATKQVDIGFHYIAHDEVWIEDTVPVGAVPGSNSETWTWNSANPGSGNWSFEAVPATGTPAWGGHHLWFTMTSSPFRVSAGEKLTFYVFIPSTSSPQPSAIMMQWYGAGNADWSRAYWGNVNALTAGTLGTYSRRHISSSLPATDTWVRLEVPASLLDLEGKNITGFGFTRTSGSGKVIWDRVGKSIMDTDLDGLPDYREDTDGDNVNDASESSISLADTDGDGLSDFTEFLLGYNPRKPKGADTGNTIGITILTPVKD